MITHIEKSDRDEEEIQKSVSQLKIVHEQPDSYKHIVVPKPWGHEFLFYEDNTIAAWYLSIEKGHATSMHCHPNKRTVLIILSGTALGKTLHKNSIIKAGDVVIYEPGVFHSTKGLTSIEMAEIESPPIKTDLLRLEDNYGREKMGYESKRTMQKTCESFYLSDSVVFFCHHYLVTNSRIIRKQSINVIGENYSGLIPNSCVIETKDREIDGNVLNFKFPIWKEMYEQRCYK